MAPIGPPTNVFMVYTKKQLLTHPSFHMNPTLILDGDTVILGSLWVYLLFIILDVSNVYLYKKRDSPTQLCMDESLNLFTTYCLFANNSIASMNNDHGAKYGAICVATGSPTVTDVASPNGHSHANCSLIM